ncbi:FAD-binding domain-containing protein [Novosphingobium sp.]|uniref:FAD-binding domain-containing protein n=1 Tax=Novosphingobium sp. TaxID=1874826 RepID=UPI0026163FED|nr:FAD-binding domain-containing protein [Novosphingobium sp.]
MAHFPLTRTDAQARLATFAPRAGSAYGTRRNLVSASGQHDHVSRLSAALRRRLISEDEVVRTVLAHHRAEAAEKFLAEVFWRTYWKGWLEQRPAVWTQYLADVDRLSAQPGLIAAAEKAMAGRTGIPAFDHWAQELEDTGYLHNWARMQVASIWTFTLGLPWQLGAKWTFDRLIDADPASNTLSWRWVAGLHTPGKTYLASADRIAAMTGGKLTAHDLATIADVADVPAHPAPTPPRKALRPDRTAPSIVLITPEDCSLEEVLDLTDVRAVAFALTANAADRTALTDAAARAEARWRCEATAANDAAALAALAQQHGCAQIVTGFAPVGPVATTLAEWRKTLSAQGVTLAENLREWDRAGWPHCRKGFFQLRARIPDLLPQYA